MIYFAQFWIQHLHAVHLNSHVKVAKDGSVNLLKIVFNITISKLI